MDELEKQYINRLVVIRVNVQDDVGRELGSFYNFKYTPTFILFDAGGQELWQEVGNIDPQRLHDSLE